MIINVMSDGANTHDGSQIRFASIISVYGDIASIQVEDGGRGWSDLAEYSAIKQGLLRLIQLKLTDEPILWQGDSMFVIRQMQGKWKIKHGKAYAPIALECLQLAKSFKSLKFEWVPREQNQMADALTKIKGLGHEKT